MEEKLLRTSGVGDPGRLQAGRGCGGAESLRWEPPLVPHKYTQVWGRVWGSLGTAPEKGWVSLFLQLRWGVTGPAGGCLTVQRRYVAPRSKFSTEVIPWPPQLGKMCSSCAPSSVLGALPLLLSSLHCLAGWDTVGLTGPGSRPSSCRRAPEHSCPQQALYSPFH